jgi:predicted nuclease with TOPRIM domain
MTTAQQRANARQREYRKRMKVKRFPGSVISDEWHERIAAQAVIHGSKKAALLRGIRLLEEYKQALKVIKIDDTGYYVVKSVHSRITKLEKENKRVCEKLTASINCTKALHKHIKDLDNSIESKDSHILALESTLGDL